ncbi:unnamed protein product [marine sediment metagenome]|uniref:Uncharacterized protein n=1 Tax=marine sediment metagenome TaxID=412755 RepID=X1GF14_9ZZZZ
MTESPINAPPSSPGPESELLKFRVPEVEDIEVVLIRLEDGTVVARTAEELEKEGGESHRGVPGGSPGA